MVLLVLTLMAYVGVLLPTAERLKAAVVSGSCCAVQCSVVPVLQLGRCHLCRGCPTDLMQCNRLTALLPHPQICHAGQQGCFPLHYDSDEQVCISVLLCDCLTASS